MNLMTYCLWNREILPLEHASHWMLSITSHFLHRRKMVLKLLTVLQIYEINMNVFLFSIGQNKEVPVVLVKAEHSICV